MTVVDNEPITLDIDAAEGFLRMFHIAHPEAGPVGPRLAEVRDEIAETGTYRHTTAELSYGTRIALRDSGWCTSGVPWRRLKVRDLRGYRNAAAVAGECVEHLRLATNGGEVRPLVTVFAPDTPTAPGPCIWNEQLVRYAGYADGTGDRRYAAFTDAVQGMGWRPPERPGRFDVLPLVVETAHEGPKLFTIPPDVVHEVCLEHPELPWFGSLGLRWHAVPLITNMKLCIGGVTYPAAPFNTWFVGSEVGTRSLADEGGYGAARPVAEALGLDTSAERTLWRDRAVVELNRAVLHSFDLAEVTITDHHAESLHRLSWLRSRQRASTNRPAFRLEASAARRARTGGPARFSHAALETTRPQSPGRLAELLRRRAEG
ncbi:nitric oxide synthase oxygenase [Saccharothrix sp. NPDC042600]|uniref:nitric oxide synthase oxygenase n=1 Tax=Saccharothrix TaxID=2071 RepID=UPI0033BFD793|nr:nitric oxide synthase oxygenase [Saccharothrix mutabilis subsp. capreolus]